MSFEEIREMIDYTITQNNAKQITGKAINLALNELLNAVEQYVADNAGGSSAEIVYLFDVNTGETSEEDKAKNALVVEKFKDAYLQGKLLPILQLDAGSEFKMIEAELGTPVEGCGTLAVNLCVYIPENSVLIEVMGTQQPGLVFTTVMDSSTTYFISEDGTMTTLS